MTIPFYFVVDVDECKSLTLNICDDPSRANCRNTYGSFECVCKLGFTGNGSHCIGKVPIIPYHADSNQSPMFKTTQMLMSVKKILQIVRRCVLILKAASSVSVTTQVMQWLEKMEPVKVRWG